MRIKRIFFYIVTVGFLSGCVQSTAMVGPAITIASTGNALDFGDMSYDGRDGGGASNSTRGIIFGGGDPAVNTISYITIATLGNAVDFGGDMDMGGGYNGACGSPTRGVCASAHPGASSNVIKYIDYATVSDGIEFGDLTGVASGMKGLSNAHGGL